MQRVDSPPPFVGELRRNQTDAATELDDVEGPLPSRLASTSSPTPWTIRLRSVSERVTQPLLTELLTQFGMLIDARRREER